MECLGCHQPVQPGEATLSYPCQCPPLHTMCGFRLAYHEYREADFVACPHCRVVYMDHRQTPNETPFVETPDFKKDLKKFKKARAASNRASTAFKRVLHQTYLQFRERALMSLVFIEGTKAEAISALKETPEYKEAQKALIAVSKLEGKLQTKYQLGFDEHERYHIRNIRRWGRWNNMPKWLIVRKFRIRL